MSRIVTFVIDDDLNAKLRKFQAKNIINNQSTSFSRVLNETLRKALK